MNPRAPRLLLVEFFSRGGLLHYAWQLAQGLARQGAAVTLLTGVNPEIAGAPAGVELLPRLCTWNPHALPPGVPRRLLRAWRGTRYLAAWEQILGWTRRLRPDAVLLGDFEHRCDAWGVARLRRLGARRGVKLGVVWHNVEGFDRGSGARLTRQPAWRRTLARQFDSVFVHGQALREQMRAATGVEARAIAHGNQQWMAEQAGPDPDLDARLRLPPRRPVALLFGTLNKYKGVPWLLEALGRMPAERRPVTVMAGFPVAGFDLAGARALARRLGLEADLRWDPRYVPTPETAWYLRRADFVVLPYLAASQSGVAHLALTFGRPMIVTRVGGLPELIVEGGNGRVVEPGDTAGLARALLELSGDAGLRARMGARAAELARTRHGWSAIAADILAGLGFAPPSNADDAATRRPAVSCFGQSGPGAA